MTAPPGAKGTAELARLQAKLARVREERDRLRAQLQMSRERIRELAPQAKAGRAGMRRAALAEEIARGGDIQAAIAGFMRSLADAGDGAFGRAIAESLMNGRDTADLGRICAAILAAGKRFDDRAAALFGACDPTDALRLAPIELLGGALREDAEAGEHRVRELLAADADLGSETWWLIAREAGAVGRSALLADLIAHVSRSDPSLAGLSAEAAASFRWTRDRLAAGQVEAVPGGAVEDVVLGIIDYKALDRNRASSNIGDYVQTLALLSNLLRFTDVTYDDTPLGRALDAIKDKVLPARRIHGIAAKVAPVAVDRDDSAARAYPMPTWTVVFGWHMHASFDGAYDFPLPEPIRPIFISFHVNKPAMLTEAAVAYLRRYGPIGCRDWTTVYLLREHGVDAFFSGCVTSTIGQVFASPPPEPRAGAIALVDYADRQGEFADAEVASFAQVYDGVRELDLPAGLRDAEAMLQNYRSFPRIVTSRLHCYLPSRSLGLNVRFRPRRRSDVRFEGLIDLDDAAFDRMRHGIEDKLERVFRLILSGAGEAEVYAGWRAIAAPDLAEADRHCAVATPSPPPSLDIAAAADRLRSSAWRHDPAGASSEERVQLAFAVDAALAAHLPVTIDSALATLSRPATINLLARGLDESYGAQLADAFPEACIRMFACDEIGYGADVRLLAHTTIATLDRLLLPDLLADADRLIYLDVDTVVRGDLAVVWEMDLRGRLLAAKDSRDARWRDGIALVDEVAKPLGAERAADLRRRMHAAGPLTFPAFNAGVLVMDLARMRADKLGQRAVALVEQYGMNDQAALNLCVRSDRVSLGSEWNAVPGQDPIDAALLIHYAGPTKPWGEYSVAGKDAYEEARRRLETRIGAGRFG